MAKRRGQGHAPRRLRKDPTNASDNSVHAQITATSNALSSAVLQRTVPLPVHETLLWFEFSCADSGLRYTLPGGRRAWKTSTGSLRPENREQTGALHVLVLSGSRPGSSQLLTRSFRRRQDLWGFLPSPLPPTLQLDFDFLPHLQ